MDRRATTERSDEPAATASDRAVSEVVGVVLLLGLVVVGTSVVVVFAAPSLQGSERGVELAHAEQAMSQFDVAASRVALGATTAQRVDLGVGSSGGQLGASADSGRLRVIRVDVINGTRTELTNRTLGAVVYDHGPATIAYQGGGVWRQDGDGSVPISRPEFHYTDETLTLPIVQVRSVEHVHSRVTVTDGGPPIRSFPDVSAGRENKVRDAKIVVEVQSDYYDAWGQYFERETSAFVRYDHPRETVTVTFLALPDTVNPRNGIIATSGPGELELAGTGAYVDSYNSSQGGYAVSSSGEGTVEAAGNVNITGDADIRADVRSGGYVGVESSAGRIEGNVSWTEGYANSGTVTGTTTQIDGVTPIDPIDGYVYEQVDRIEATNDNNRTTLISSEELTGSGELGPGTYYLDRLDLRGDRLVVNVTAGNVTIAVEEWVAVRRQGGTGGNLTVKGDGRVRLLVKGSDEVTVSPTGLGSREADVFVGKGSSVHVPDERARRLQVLAPKDSAIIVAGSNSNRAELDGVVYAPAGPTGGGYTYVKQGDLYGAVVTGNLTLGQYGAVHFDLALADEPLPLSPTISRLEYLHVATHRVNVTGG